MDSRFRGNDVTFERATPLPASGAVSAFLTALTWEEIWPGPAMKLVGPPPCLLESYGRQAAA